MERICPEHNKALVNRQGVSKKGPNLGKAYNFWGCPNKDDGGYCKFTMPGETAQSPTNTPQREELVGKVLTQIINQLNRIEAKIDAITPTGVGVGNQAVASAQATPASGLPF